jgi:hypothetical protein
MNVIHYLDTIEVNYYVLFPLVWAMWVLMYIDLSTWTIPIMRQGFLNAWMVANFRTRVIYVLEIVTLSPFRLMLLFGVMIYNPRRYIARHMDLKSIRC